MEHVTSADGTQIAYDRSGRGPALILVHGAATDRGRWRLLRQHLDDHFTVYAMDRRGRGGSGDSETYSFERESEDVIALATSIDDCVSLYGHSGGGNAVLEAAPRVSNLHRVAIYEAVTPVGEEIFPRSLIDSLQKLIDDDRIEDALVFFLKTVVRMPDHELEHVRSLPDWPSRVAATPAIPRELSGMNHYRFDPARFENLNSPVLLLVGTDSPPIFTKSAEILRAGVPNSQIHYLEGQQHLADLTAPEMVAEALVGFLRDEN